MRSSGMCEVRLHGTAVLDVDLKRERLAQPIERGALHLVLGADRIDDMTADVDRDPDLVDLDAPSRRPWP